MSIMESNDKNYPSTWGICARTYVEGAPEGVRFYENVISGELHAVVDDRNANTSLFEKLGVTQWTFGNKRERD